MEELKTSAQNLRDHVKEYASTYIEITKAKFAQGASNAASGAVIGVAAFLLGFFFLLFLFFAIAYGLGSLLDSTAAGFFIVAGFFLLLIILIFALRKKVIVPLIRNTIIGKVYE